MTVRDTESPQSARATGQPSAVRSLTGLAARLVVAWWKHLVALALACGIVAATIAGALGVGRSLQGGLRDLALSRLGGIDAAVVADGLFRAELAIEMAARLAAAGAEPTSPPSTGATVGPLLVPALVMEVSLEVPAAAGSRGRVSQATLLACDTPRSLGFSPAEDAPAADAVAINESLAQALGAQAGAAVVIRVPKPVDVPSDNPLGRRSDESWSKRLRVDRILPASGLGGFSLRPAQVTGGLVVTSLAAMQAVLRLDESRVNAVLVVGGEGKRGTVEGLAAALQPTLDDLGLDFAPPADGRGPRLSSRRLVLPPEADRAAREVLGPLGGRPTLAFLATSLRPVVAGQPATASVPYSTVVGIDAPSLPVGALVDDAGAVLALPGPDGIVIDRWLADDLAAQAAPVAVGDAVEIRFFLPETMHGRVEEASRTLRIEGIAAMESAAVARDLVPDVQGVTDEASIADWDPPFPFDPGRVRTTPPHDEDDRYWKRYGATPKAFVNLATARALAGSRFGVTTAWHLPVVAPEAGVTAGAAVAAAIDPARIGMRILPVRAQALAAARGSTPFGVLFLALSSFVVASGLILEWLLFSLLVAARRRDVGILSALGWPAGRLAALLASVGAGAAAAGIVVGTIVGPLWSRVLLGWLGEAWNADVAAGSADVFAAGGIRWRDIAWAVPGALAAAVVSMTALALAARSAAALPPLTLLKGRGDVEPVPRRGGSRRAGRWAGRFAVVGPLVAVLLAGWGRTADPQVALAAFFGAGMAALAGLLGGVALVLGRPAARGGRPLQSLAGLGWRGLVEGRRRAFSVAAIVACAEFLIVAVSAFALHPPPDLRDRRSPTGGYDFLARFGTPSAVDPGDPAAAAALGLSDDDRALLAECRIERIRSSGGDDASCVNLYASTQPAVLGVGDGFITRGGFRFVAHAPLAEAREAHGNADAAGNPWTLLERPTDGALPVIVDQATAQWALKLGGVGATFRLDGDEGPVELEIVGLLEPGILQGFLLISDRNFTRLFPRRSGYGMALVDASAVPTAGSDRVRAAVAAAFADAGVTVVGTGHRLRSLQAVQNTFLSGFQALGTLGLLLGAAGVAAAQFQSVLERAGAFGLMMAVGFTAGRLRWLVVLETACMLLLGLAAGTVAGGLAVAPAFLAGTAAVPAGWIAATWGLSLAAALLAGLAAASLVTRLEPARVLAARV